jgi:hypothetical protein
MPLAKATGYLMKLLPPYTTLALQRKENKCYGEQWISQRSTFLLSKYLAGD